MTKTTVIHEGMTYEYLVPGLFVMVFGGILLVLNIILGTIILFFGILLMILSTGIEVDVSNQRIRKYKSFFFIKSGKWQDLKNIIQIELKYNANAVRIKGPATASNLTLPWIVPNAGAAAKTFDLYLINDIGEEKLLNQFLKFGLALKTLKILEQIQGIKIINHFEAMIKAQRKEHR